MTDPSSVVSPATPLVEALNASGSTLSVAESVTGGLLASTVTDVPGASQVLDRSIVAYTVEAKVDALDVPRELIEDHGPVSDPVATAMAEGVRHAAGTRWSLATTGVAGPTRPPGHPPVGTVLIATAGPDATTVQRHRFDGDRWTVKQAAVQAALDALIDRLEA